MFIADISIIYLEIFFVSLGDLLYLAFGLVQFVLAMFYQFHPMLVEVDSLFESDFISFEFLVYPL